jgi:hypothetical protein
VNKKMKSKQSKPKEEIMEFIKKQRKYSRRISTYKKEELMNAFYCRSYSLTVKEQSNAEINSMDFDGKKISDNKKE